MNRNPSLAEDSGFEPESLSVPWAARMIANTIQMGFANAYINGLEIPDQVLRALLDASARLSYDQYQDLLVPYDWLLKESDQLAEGFKELM